MDEVDFKILFKLLDDSQRPFSEIAKDVGVSTDTVIRRFKKLKESGAFKPTILVDYRKFGFQGSAWYNILISPQTKTKIIDEISKIKNIVYIVKAVGDYDILAMALVKDVKHVFEIGEKLGKIPGINTIDVRLYCSPNGGDSRLGKAFARGFYRPDNEK